METSQPSVVCRDASSNMPSFRKSPAESRNSRRFLVSPSLFEGDSPPRKPLQSFGKGWKRPSGAPLNLKIRADDAHSPSGGASMKIEGITLRASAGVRAREVRVARQSRRTFQPRSSPRLPLIRYDAEGKSRHVRLELERWSRQPRETGPGVSQRSHFTASQEHGP